jgi:Polysulphide reductase, NrfD
MRAPEATPVGYEHGPVTKAPNWHGLVTLDILFNNLSTGLFLAMAVGELVEPGIFRPLAAVAYPIALILLISDLVCLVLDLGDPSRFHHMLRVWKPSSPMSLGTWVLSGYSGPLTVLTLMSLLPAETGGLEWLRRLLLVLGSGLALGAAVYKGVLFSTTAQPGWRDARWLGSYLANSALVLGAAELLLLAIAKRQPEAVALLRHALMFLLMLNLVVLALVLADVRAALARARGTRLLGAIAAVVFLAGLLAPLGLLALGTSVPMVGAVVLIVVSALVVRSEIVQLPHLQSNGA